MEDVSGDIPSGAVGHEGLSPEAQQGFGLLPGCGFSKNERDIFLDPGPAGPANFFMSPARPQFRQDLRLPQRLLTPVQHELNGSNHRVFDSRTQQGIEEELRLEHQQTHMKPDHVSLGLPRKPLAAGKQLARTDQNGIGRLQRTLNISDGRFGLFQTALHALAHTLPPQAAQKEQGQQHHRDHQQDAFVDQVQKVHDDRNHGGHNARNRIPIEAQ